jgi:hypothetical protein
MTPLAKKVFELFGKPELGTETARTETDDQRSPSIMTTQNIAEPQAGETQPYINSRGELIIPFTSDRRYHYWAGGQSIAATLRELNASPEVWERYTEAPYGQVQ